jgi:hypothetical protein
VLPSAQCERVGELSIRRPSVAEDRHSIRTVQEALNLAVLQCGWFGRVDELDEHVEEALGFVELGEVA